MEHGCLKKPVNTWKKRLIIALAASLFAGQPVYANQVTWIPMKPVVENKEGKNPSKTGHVRQLNNTVKNQKPVDTLDVEKGLKSAFEALQENQKKQEELLNTLALLQQQAEQVKQQEIIRQTLLEMQKQMEEEFKKTLNASIESLRQKQEEEIALAKAEAQAKAEEAIALVKEELAQAKLAEERMRLEIQRQNEEKLRLEDEARAKRASIYEVTVDQKAAIQSVAEAINDSMQDANDANKAEAAVRFFYQDGGLYKIYCKEGFLTDIQLQPGEEITAIMGGDTSRWTIDRAQAGDGTGAMRWHVYIKPQRSGIETNIVIATNKRSYQIQAVSVNWFVPIVSWTYPQEEKMAIFRAKQKEQQLADNAILTAASSYDSLNFNYRIKDGKKSWAPKMVYDDGVKTYIKMPDSIASNELPVLFVRSGKKLTMVNYRYKNGTFIVDRLFNEAELRVSQKDTVRIVKERSDE